MALADAAPLLLDIQIDVVNSDSFAREAKQSEWDSGTSLKTSSTYENMGGQQIFGEKRTETKPYQFQVDVDRDGGLRSSEPLEDESPGAPA
ncbi:hypothetical protein MMC21_008384 [Puttea exsequens]|nr:hypothetical protein [Puttea exsequens]